MRIESRFPLFLVYVVLGVVALGLLALSGNYASLPTQLSASDQASGQPSNDPRLQKAWRFERGEEVPDYYVPWLEEQQKKQAALSPLSR